MNTPSHSWIDYDYAVLRVMPHVHLCTFVNVGVVVHARTAGFLDTRFHVDRKLLGEICPDLDLELLERYVAAYEQVSRGGADAGPIGLLPPSERFHWLTAPRSAVLQVSEVHGGRAADLKATLDHLFDEYVLTRKNQKA